MSFSLALFVIVISTLTTAEPLSSHIVSINTSDQGYVVVMYQYKITWFLI